MVKISASEDYNVIAWVNEATHINRWQLVEDDAIVIGYTIDGKDREVARMEFHGDKSAKEDAVTALSRTLVTIASL